MPLRAHPLDEMTQPGELGARAVQHERDVASLADRVRPGGFPRPGDRYLARAHRVFGHSSRLDRYLIVRESVHDTGQRERQSQSGTRVTLASRLQSQQKRSRMRIATNDYRPTTTARDAVASMTESSAGPWDSTYHAPVLADEVVALLAGARSVLDGTLGGGGHSLALLGARLGRHGGRSRSRGDQRSESTARELRESRVASGRCSATTPIIDANPASSKAVRFDGILLDLGVSSHQLDDPVARLLVSRRRSARHAHGH